MRQNILVPMASGTEEMEAVIIIDLLRRAGCNVVIAGENEIINCANNIKIFSERILEDLDDEVLYDAIVIPGGQRGVYNLEANDKLRIILEFHLKNNRLIAAICAAPSLLLSFNLLKDDYLVTSHPTVKSIFPQSNYSEEIVVHYGQFITSKGAGTAIEFTLKIIEVLINKQAAKDIAEKIVFNYSN